MEFLIIALVACGASLLTFFSGFGLGTILTPVFIFFFPLDVAIALTGIVHFLNNLFKIGLIFKEINWRIVAKFGITSMIGAFVGAYVLTYTADLPSYYSYIIGEREFEVTLIKVIIGFLMIGFALFDIIPRLKAIQFDEKHLYSGGIVSGFFGGLSGHQGALRSAFLIKCNLHKEAFIATGVVIASAVDITRLSVYFSRIDSINFTDNIPILATAVFAAFVGAIAGKKLLKKITMDSLQLIVGILIILMGIGMIVGLI
jgi:uncharacterized membrane protein YfcA